MYRIGAIPYTRRRADPPPNIGREALLPLACGAVAAALGVALLTLAPPSGDAPSHLFQIWLYRHGGFQLWNNLWYAGRYEFVSYSVLYYPLAAHTGELPVLIVAAGILAVCFAAVCRREWGSAARNPAIAFACTTPFVSIVPAHIRSPPVRPASRWRCSRCNGGGRLVFSVAVVAALGFSPLAFAVLLALLAGLLLGHPQPIVTARRHWTAIAVVVIALLTGVFLQRAFPSGGIYPYNLTDAVVVVLFSLAGLYVTGSSARARSLRMLFIAYLILNLTAFLFKSPVVGRTPRASSPSPERRSCGLRPTSAASGRAPSCCCSRRRRPPCRSVRGSATPTRPGGVPPCRPHTGGRRSRS